MLPMLEKGIRGGVCQVSHHYANANNKYLKNHDKNKESLYIEYLDANNLLRFRKNLNITIDDYQRSN